GIGNAGLFDDLHAQGKAGKLEILPVTGSFSCSGSVGRFSLTFNGNDKPVTRTVSSIVIADEVKRKPNFSLYGVRASSGVASLSQVYEWIESGSKPAKKILLGKRIAFLTGLMEESNPVTKKSCVVRLNYNWNSIAGRIYLPEISRLPETGWKIFIGRPKKQVPST
ncbi:MAG: hypothetical protein JRJ39_11985, partial [Deltaproteobacteria bacterium]|nr:hypothetical protein [Deltaproteobacteria bacterium]